MDSLDFDETGDSGATALADATIRAPHRTII